jgi:predicted phage terminase large subunit-like protein
VSSLTTEGILSAARNSLLSYAMLFDPAYEAPDHIVTLAKALMAVDSGEIKRLIISMPPRHGKSRLVSQLFPAWYKGRNPGKYLITSTYGQELSDDFGRKVRDQLRDPLFKAVFPGCVMRSNTTAANRFETEAGGQYFAVGVGGPITGRGADLLLIDDPIKNREDADSRAIRDKINDWYGSTAYTRLMPGGAVILVMTRWHEEDLVGYVLENNAHENWHVINMPALDNQNKSLWPERYGYDDMIRIKNTLSEYDWQCLYMQDPIPREGHLIKAEWLKEGVPSDEDIAARYMAIDPAISKKETADETAISVWGVGYGEVPNYYELETVYGRFDLHEIIQRISNLQNKHKCIQFGVESVAFQKSLADIFQRQGQPCVALPADGDKVRRLMSVQHLFSQGRCYVNTPKLRKQLLRFRGEATGEDDLLDAAVHCLRLINQSSGHVHKKEINRYAHLNDETRAYWEGVERKKQADKGNAIRQVLGY